jgi:alpha-2-macroglobulin
MKAAKFFPLFLSFVLVISCGPKENKPLLKFNHDRTNEYVATIPLDKGFSEYIAGYTSGIIPSNSAIEIRFTPEFAAKADKSATGLFVFDPAINGKTEWKDETTLVFTPSRLLDAGKTYTGGLNLNKLATVTERLKVFPLRIQTLKKDFRLNSGFLTSSSPEGNGYLLNGEIIASDFVEAREAEDWLRAKLGRKKLDISWDHSDRLIHKFSVSGIERNSETQELTLLWDGSSSGVNQKGTSIIKIPPSGEFSVIDIIPSIGENQKIDIIFSDPVEAAQEMDGLIQFTPNAETTVNINSNIITLFPANRLQGKVNLNIESSVKNNKGASLKSSFLKELDFTAVPPGIKTEGKGVILPASKNLIFPFKAANLRAVDLRIVKIFDNNLPYFLQENDLNGNNSIKRFGRPVYSGRVDLVNNPGMNTGTWNLYTIDLADYIDVEPGILYKVTLGMRRSYSIYPCSSSGEDSKYEAILQQSEEKSREFWDDPDNYYSDSYDDIYYGMDFDWKDRDNPCMDAYYYPDRSGTRNILASNIGLIAKKGEDKLLHVMASDLISAMPLNGVTIDVYDFQMQEITSGTTGQNGSTALFCERKPFLVIAKKDKDRNYLKVNDGSSLSLSSFDVTGSSPENGIKAFIYGDRKSVV